MMDKLCKNCIYWGGATRESYKGLCLLNPPIALEEPKVTYGPGGGKFYSYSIHPDVSSHDFCSFFEPMEV